MHDKRQTHSNRILDEWIDEQWVQAWMEGWMDGQIIYSHTIED